MKKQLLLPLILIQLLMACAHRQDSPSGLMIEFIREPQNVKILDLKPEFSWIVPVTSGYQIGYQIMIASSEEKLKNDNPDIWDSKMVIDDSSTEIELDGANLPSESSFFWKVRIWNEDGQPSQYSDIQSFSTGKTVNYLTTPNTFQTSLIKPAIIKKLAENHYFIDFGKDAFGTLEIEFNPVKIDTIIVYLGEKIVAKDRVDRNPPGSIRYHKVLLPVIPGITKYILNLPVDQRNTGPAAIHLPDSFGVLTPFRYCELENLTIDPSQIALRQKAFRYYFDDDMSSFTSSDTILNKIWDLCKYTIKATSFAGIYIDGDRERIPYEADAYINQMGHYYTDREYSMARRTNEYFINHPTWPTEWILHTVPMFYYDFMYTGNIESVRNFYEELMSKTLVALSQNDGLISSKNCTDEIMLSLGFANKKERLKDIVDWPPSQKDTGWKLATPEGERDGYDMVEINTAVNAFYFRGLICMSELAGKLGKFKDSVLIHTQAMKTKAAINEKLLNKTTGIYNDGESSQHSSLHANMIALACNLVPEENLEKVVNFIKSRGMACSVYGAQYLLEGLYIAGEADYALKLLTATDDRSWWNMIRSGSTITMEAWDLKYKPNSDWNHAWGAAPSNIIPRFLWGIVPSGPGYSSAIIRPQLGTLKYSKISVPTIRGNITAEFHDNEKRKVYSISIPANMECEFVIPLTINTLVFLNDEEITPAGNHLKLKPGLNKITICES